MARRLLIVIKPFRVEAVLQALRDVRASAITLTEARGYGRQKGRLELYREEAGGVTFLPKVRIECVVDDAQVEAALESVGVAARTGRIGDGKIFVEELA